MARVIRHLTHLETVGLIKLAQSYPELEYMFRHALVQEAAYNSLLIEDRKKLHRQVGEAIEQSYPDQVGSRDLAPVLADHFAKAEDDQRALKYFTLAGDADTAAYANSEAVAHYTRALHIARRIESGSEVLIKLYTSLGRVLELNSLFDRALITYKEMEMLGQERQDRPLELVSLIGQVTLYATPTPVHNSTWGQSLGQQTLNLARELGDQIAEAKLLWILSIAYVHSGEISQAIDYGKRSLALARQLNLREQMAYTLNDLGIHAYYASGRFDRAKAVLAEASDLWRELGNLPMLANSLASSCTVHIYTGDYDQALSFSEEAYEVSQAIGNLWGQSFSQYKIGDVYWERGQPDRALAVMEESLRLSEPSGFFVPQVETRADLAIVYGSLGAIERGLELAQLAFMGAQSQHSLWQAYGLAALAQLHLWQRNLAEAETTLDRGKKEHNWEIMPKFSVTFILAEGELALRQENYAQAIAVTDLLLTKLRQFGQYMPKALYLQAQALLGLGQDNAARDRLREARAKAESIDSRWILWQILATLAEIETDPTEAALLRQQAQDLIDYIADHTPAELRVSFLNLPSVRAVLDG